jgi:hypothetical protein
MISDALCTSASVLMIPVYPNKKYQIEFKHRPTIPNNVKYWQLFEDDKQIIKFLQMKEEYENVQIDEEIFYNKN